MRNLFKQFPVLHQMAPLIAICLCPLALGGCGGGTGAGNPGNIALQSAPLAGPNAASLDRPGLWIADLMETFMGLRSAFAAVSSFSNFKLCNDTLVMTDTNGNTVPINGSTSGTGLGLLNFSPTSTTPMALTSLTIVAGTQIKEIDITSAVKPDTCSGVSYAVLFDTGSGANLITQNTAFKFTFSTPMTITGNAQTLSLLFGQIVNGMVNLVNGSGLTNSSIQTVNVGQAK